MTKPDTYQGDPPELEAWFFDEQQDTSALLDAVCRRLIAAALRMGAVYRGDTDGRPFPSFGGGIHVSPPGPRTRGHSPARPSRG